MCPGVRDFKSSGLPRRPLGSPSLACSLPGNVPRCARGACYRDGAPGPAPPPHPFLGSGGRAGDRTGGGPVSFRVCSPPGWCILAPVCFVTTRAQLSMAPLIVGPQSFSSVRTSRRAPSLPSGRLWNCAPPVISALLLRPALSFPAVPHTSAGRRLSAPSFLGSVRLCLPVHVSYISEPGARVLGVPAWRRPVQIPQPRPRRGARQALAVTFWSGLSGRRVRGRERHAVFCSWLTPARWLCRSPACLRRRGRVPERGGRPAFLRSGRNLDSGYWSPEEPSCSPEAPPGLSRRPGLLAGHSPSWWRGTSHLQPPFPPRESRGSAGAGRQGSPPPPRVRGVPLG